MATLKQIEIAIVAQHKVGARISTTVLVDDEGTDAQKVLAGKLLWLNKYINRDVKRGVFYDLPSARKAAGGIKINGNIL